jgi:hypothetical protein
MLVQRLLPAILIVLLTTAALTAQTILVKAAADECKTRPGSAAAPGTHWYYRVNHNNNLRCWYLGPQPEAVRSHASGAISHVHRQPGRRIRSVLLRQLAPNDRKRYPQTASAQTVPGDAALPEPQARELVIPVDFAARWLDLPKAQNLDAREVATVSYSETYAATGADQQRPSASGFLDAKNAGLRQAYAGKSTFGSVLLDGTLMMVLMLLACGILKITRREDQSHLRPQWRAPEGRPRTGRHMRRDSAEATSRKSVAGARHGSIASRTPRPDDLDDDLKMNLRQLMGCLQRAGAAHLSPRSFAPPARTRRLGGVLKRATV